MRLFMWITKDEYELPLFVTESAEELARVSGRTKETVYSNLCNYRKGRIKKTFVVEVEVEDDDL